MKNRLIKSLRPFLTFGMALLILGGWIFLQPRTKWDFLQRLDVFVFFLFFWLVMEAVSQANPNHAESALLRLLVRFSNRRDKIVVLIASITTLIAASAVPSISFLRTADPFLQITLSILTALIFYFGICLSFGTRELKELILPKLIKRIIHPENPEGK